MKKEDRCTHRTTLCTAPWGLWKECQPRRTEQGNTYVSVRIRSCSSCKLAAISGPHGDKSSLIRGFPDAGPVLMTLWK